MYKKVSLKDINRMAVASKKDITQTAKECGRPIKIYLHWTAGRYDTMFSDYHINIKGNGDIYVTTSDFDDILAHTYRRNSGSIGITLCCAFNATSKKLGSYPPTNLQIDTMAQVVCVLCDSLGIPIDKKHVMTHGEAADNEDGLWPHSRYGPLSTCERWDLEYLGTDESPSFNPRATNGTRGGDVLRGKAIWYQNNGLLHSL